MAKTIKSVFKIVRGLEAELPILRIGELGYATDSNTLFVGDPDEGNVKINFNNEDREMLNTIFKEMDKKIDVEPGKGLSTNDLTNELLEKILESASENFVINKIAEAQLDIEGGDVDLSGLASKDDLDGKVDKVAGYSLISDAELTRLASVSNYDDTDIKRDIDKKADINHQHDQYLTSIPSQYVTNTQLTAKGYATTSSVNATLSIYAKSSAIPTKISQLTDDVGYLISIPEEYVTDSELNIVLAPYALTADIPTKVGQLANDKGYLTSIPEEYITETELNDKGYATTTEVDQKIAEAAINGAVDLSGYALKTEIPTDISQLNNDSNYLTTIPYEYVTETELEAELINKVDKVSGKGLSTNDLTNEMVTKIDNAATQAYVTNAIAEARLDGSDVDLSGLATKDELNEKAPLTHSHNISDVSDLQAALDSKVDAVSGKSLISNTEIVRLASVDNYDDTEIRGLIPTKVSQLINDRNYLNSVPSEYVTETELETELNNKVDKEAGYSLVSDAEIARLANVDNYDDTEVRGLIPTKVSDLTNDSNYLTSIPSEYVTETELQTSLDSKVDKVSGKGLSTNDLTNEMVTKIDNAATQAYVTNAIAEARLDGSDVDLSGLATKDELNEKAPLTHSHNISDVSGLQDALNSKVNTVSGKSLVSDTEIARLANVDNYDDTEIRGLIPTKVSQLTNDKNYLTSVPSEYVTETELNNKGYATTAEVDQKIAGAVTGGTIDLSGYALKTEVPTKTSQLTNDSNYLTTIPSEYVTETELNNITGVLSTLETANKSTLVAAINELVNIVSKLQNIEILGEIVLSTTSLNLIEGNTGTINVKMDRFITHNQIVTISSNNSGVTISPSTLTFTSDNYNSNQAVTVTAVQDDDTDDLTATLTFKSDKVSNKTATVKVTDDDDVSVTPQEDYMYYGRLTIEEVGGKVIQYSEITEEMIKTGKKIKKEVASTKGKTSLGDIDDTAEGDYGIVAVPASKGYTVTTDNGFGGKTTFSEDVAGANGIDITIDGILYKLYGDIYLSQGTIYIYID